MGFEVGGVPGLVERAVGEDKGASLRLPHAFPGLIDVVGNANAAVTDFDHRTVARLLGENKSGRGSRRGGDAAGVGVAVADEFQIRIHEGESDAGHGPAGFQRGDEDHRLATAALLHDA